MVSRQLVYVTGMLEVILAPSAPSGRLRPPAKFSWYPACLAGVPDGPFLTPRGGCGRLRSFPSTRQSWPASLTPLPRPRKPSNNLFEPFRPLGNLQTTCLGLSDPSETFKQLVWAFPTPRKPSNNLFEPFRPLGRRSNEWRESASTIAPLPPLRICPIFTPT